MRARCVSLQPGVYGSDMIEVVVQNRALLARRLSSSDLHPIILGGDLIHQK